MRWNEYVAANGFIFDRRGADIEISRVDYLANESRPTLFYGPQQNRGWNVMARIAEIIRPIGRTYPRNRAMDANLPVFDQGIFVPWDDVGDDQPDASRVTHNVRTACQFIRQDILPLLKMTLVQPAAAQTSIATIVNDVADHSPRAGYGLGRGVHRLFRGMVDFGTNVIHSYDGSLATAVPCPVGVFDDTQKRMTPLAVQQIDGTYQISTRVVWTILYHIGYVFDSPQYLAHGEATMPVNAEFPSPPETLDAHLSVFAYCERATIGAGIANAILDEDNQGQPAYIAIRGLLRTARSEGEVLASSAYKKLEHMILSTFAKECSGHSQTEGLPNMNLTGDTRYARPVFRRITPVQTPAQPVATDPAILVGAFDILTPIYKRMFEYGVTVLLDERSALSRIGTGFGVYRVMDQNVDIHSVFNPPDWPTAVITQENFVLDLLGGRTVVAFKIGELKFYESSTLPNYVFEINNPGLFSQSQIEFLCGAVCQGRIALIMPRAKYVY